MSLWKIRDLQLQIFEEIPKACSDLFTLRQYNFFFRLFFDLLESFHAQTQLSVFKDSDYRELFHDENCLIYERRKGGEVAVIAVNRGQNKFDLQYQGILYDLFAEKEYQDRYEIKPLSWQIFSNIRIF